MAARHFHLSRSAITKHLHVLVAQGVLKATGKTKARSYRLRSIAQKAFTLQINSEVYEDVIWRENIKPLLLDMKENVLNICAHGFNEMLNNAIDHSEAATASIRVRRDAAQIRMVVHDHGVGIFNKIQREFNLNDPQHAILELAKGKLTTDKQRHTGEGIFFTSRMFDYFMIESGHLSFCRSNRGDLEGDWLLDSDEKTLVRGTSVTLLIHTNATQTVKEIFDKYRAEFDEYGFSRTVIPLALLKYEGEQLISRSQAKRLLARVDQFKEVVLDFRGITTIGQAFADEIFRVYRGGHPNVTLRPVHTNDEINRIIQRAESLESSGSTRPSSTPHRIQPS